MSLPHPSSDVVARRLAVFAIVVFFGLPLFLGLGRIDLRNDEAIYSYAVDSILETGDWLTPASSPDTSRPGDPHERATAPFLEKPPLKIWIVAATIKVGLLPHDEFGLRFWDALFGALAFVYVFLIGRRLVDSVCGLGAVFLLFIQWWFVFRHGLRANVMEAALVLAYCGGIYHFLRWSDADGQGNRWRHIMSFAAWLTLATMTKFVAAVFLPIIAGSAALAVRDWRHRLWADRWRWVGGATLTFALSAPWFVYEHLRFGDEFWQIIFGRHVYERMVDSLDPGHIQPWSYYFTELAGEMGVADARLWLFAGVLLWIGDTIRRRWAGGFLVIGWFFLPVVLISMSISKIFHYAFPFLPAAALMAAYPLSLLVRMALGKPTGFDRLDAMAAWPKKRGWGDATSSFLTNSRVRAILWLIMASAALIAAATLVSGQIEVTAFGVRLFRNSSVVRPLMLAMLCSLPLFWSDRAAALPVLVVVAFLFPTQRYETTFERALTIDSPMRTVRDCVVEIDEQIGDLDPGVERRLYLHLPAGIGLTHNYYYYFRVLDIWERPSTLDDARLESRLFGVGEQAPTLILEPDYLAFLERLETSRNTGALPNLPPALMLGVGYDGMTEALILLPGPFAVCAVSGEAQGGHRYEAR